MADIVIVDDSKLWLELYERSLTAAGHRCRSFKNGSDALKEIDQRGADLVILDIRMSPSGREVLKSLQAGFPDLPVIVNTSYAGYRDDPDFQSATAFIVKSTDTTLLLEAVDRILIECSERAG